MLLKLTNPFSIDQKMYSLIDNHNMDIDEFRRIGLHYLKLGEQLGDYNCTKTIYNLLQREQLPPQDWKPIQYYKEKADSLFSLIPANNFFKFSIKKTP